MLRVFKKNDSFLEFLEIINLILKNLFIFK
jgi:hypothetical protein